MWKTKRKFKNENINYRISKLINLNYETNLNKLLENSLIVFDFFIEKLKAYKEIIFIFGKSWKFSSNLFI